MSCLNNEKEKLRMIDFAPWSQIENILGSVASQVSPIIHHVTSALQLPTHGIRSFDAIRFGAFNEKQTDPEKRVTVLTRIIP